MVSETIYGHLMVLIGTGLLFGRLFEFEWEGEGEGDGRLLTFSAFSLVKVDANWRLGAYSNKYGRSIIKLSLKKPFKRLFLSIT